MSEPRARVLVVDDEPQVREVLLKICARLSVDAVGEGDGLAAWETLRREPFDAVLLDLFLPGIDGLEILRRLRADPPALVPGVLVLTSANDPASQATATDLGVMDYAVKPFRMVDLERRLSRVLGIVELERRLQRAEERLRNLRAVDPVTGVAATSQLFAVLEAEFNAAQVGNRPLSCIVISDESYDRALHEGGRSAGDQRLLALAAAIGARLRGADRVFRVDAAEFVVLLPGTPKDGARRVIEKITEAANEVGGLRAEQLAIAVAAYPHPELVAASQLYRAVNVTLAQARSRGRLVVFEGF